MDGNDITIFGDGQQKRDYIYVDDIVDAMIKSIDEEDIDKMLDSIDEQIKKDIKGE